MDKTLLPGERLYWLPGHRTPEFMEITNQTLEILILTALDHYGGQTKWSTLCIKVQALLDELYPTGVQVGRHYSAIQASIQQLQAKGFVQVEAGSEPTKPTAETLVRVTANEQN